MSQSNEWEQLVDAMKQIPVIQKRQQDCRAALEDLKSKMASLVVAHRCGDLSPGEFHHQRHLLLMEIFFLDFVNKAGEMKINEIMTKLGK